MPSMRKRFTACAVMVTLGGLTGSLATATAEPAPRTVKVGDNWFVRDSSGVPTITAARGTTFVFRFVGDTVHNIVGYRGGSKRFESPVKSSGTYRKTLRAAGTYKLICSIHGASDQSMKIVVQR